MLGSLAVVQIPSTPLPNFYHSNNPSTPPPHPPPEGDMATSIKLQNFKGIENEDVDQLWFVADDVWTTQHINNDNVNKLNLDTTFQECMFDWYMRYMAVHPISMIDELKTTLKEQFKKLKSYSQCMTELKGTH